MNKLKDSSQNLERFRSATKALRQYKSLLLTVYHLNSLIHIINQHLITLKAHLLAQHLGSLNSIHQVLTIWVLPKDKVLVNFNQSMFQKMHKTKLNLISLLAWIIKHQSLPMTILTRKRANSIINRSHNKIKKNSHYIQAQLISKLKSLIKCLIKVFNQVGRVTKMLLQLQI